MATQSALPQGTQHRPELLRLDSLILSPNPEAAQWGFGKITATFLVVPKQKTYVLGDIVLCSRGIVRQVQGLGVENRFRSNKERETLSRRRAFKLKRNQQVEVDS